MTELKEIRDAMLRLTCIERTQVFYDPANQVFGDGPIHYMVQVGDLFLIAWENNDTRHIVLNPINRFDLDELAEMGAEDAWTVLHLPPELGEGIQIREIDEIEMIHAYHRMEGWTLTAPPFS